ncbi:hypothetical protein HMPREF9431_02415 [Segatella oulorum F0390]|uniref:Uncharacterized protein n=1 Tax=Segatella oulorum F0390 TaxID=702438 RepID=G1WF14_9BACT|nr:hypothetical protein HMPREF9431_02415 [Segatella oulorum F0390]
MYLGDGRLVQRQDNSEHPEIKYYLLEFGIRLVCK